MFAFVKGHSEVPDFLTEHWDRISLGLMRENKLEVRCRLYLFLPILSMLAG